MEKLKLVLCNIYKIWIIIYKLFILEIGLYFILYMKKNFLWNDRFMGCIIYLNNECIILIIEIIMFWYKLKIIYVVLLFLY